MRNSWGRSFADGGYFWVSYYDAGLARSDDSVAFTRVDAPGAYDHVYSYDKLGWTSSAGAGSTTAKFANRFTATAAGKVAAVSFYTDAPDATYKVYAGRSLAGLSTRGGGTVSQAGYVTVPLSTQLNVTKGVRFVVAVSLHTGSPARPSAGGAHSGLRPGPGFGRPELRAFRRPMGRHHHAARLRQHQRMLEGVHREVRHATAGPPARRPAQGARA